MAETQQEQDFNITETFSKAEDFANKNKKSLMIIGGAIILAIGGYLFYQYNYVAGKEKEAESQMFRAEEYYRNDSLRLAIAGDGNAPGFEQVIDDYGVSPSANLAHFYLGVSYLKKKQYDKAIETLKSYNAKDEITPSLTLAAIGDAYMEQNNTDEAITYYEKASKEKPNEFTTPIILMKLGGAYEVKKEYKDAADTYQKLKKEFGKTPEGQQADKYLAKAEAMVDQK